MKVKAVQYMVNSWLPEELRDYQRPLDAKGLSRMMHQVAVHSPDKYADIVKKVGDMGRNAAYWQGETMGINDLKDVIDVPAYLKTMDQEVKEKTKGLKDPGEIKRTREGIWGTYAAKIERESMAAALAQENAVGQSVASGARGKPLQLRAMLATPAIFEDSKGRIVPIFARRSYARGVSPAEWLAGTHGARTSVVSTKKATARGGYFSKMLGQLAAPLIVTEKDCGTTNGIDLPNDDRSLRNRFLARSTAGLGDGALIDRKSTALLRNGKDKVVLVRSAMTCQSKQGVCAKCLGADPVGRLHPIGYAAGITASQAVGEPLTQGALNCLVKGTLVRMADMSVLPIEEIQAGARVMGADREGNFFPVTVTAAWDQGLQPVVEYVFTAPFKSQMRVTATAAHKLLMEGPAGLDKITLGGSLGCDAVLFGTQPRGKFLVEHPEEDLMHCFDISVDHPDELFVLANGLVVSNTKHVSGAAKQKRSYSGLDWLERFVQVPDNFPDRAPVAEEDGVVTVRPAPQGGHYVMVGEHEHYVGQGLDLKVKSGDRVEAGEALSDGLVRPDDVVRLRGVGEGRRYYAERLGQMLNDSAAESDPRNVEVLARAAVDHAQVTDPDDDDDHDGIMPDDTVSFSSLRQNKPEDTRRGLASSSVGRYLQSPVLHFTPGTRLTPKMAQRIEKAGIQEVESSEQKPRYVPKMVRLQVQAFSQPDWLANMGTSYLSKQLAHGASRGQDTNIKENIHFAPRLAVGVGFGENIERTGKF